MIGRPRRSRPRRDAGARSTAARRRRGDGYCPNCGRALADATPYAEFRICLTCREVSDESDPIGLLRAVGRGALTRGPRRSACSALRARTLDNAATAPNHSREAEATSVRLDGPDEGALEPCPCCRRPVCRPDTCPQDPSNETERP
jgi:hypothetical protein